MKKTKKIKIEKEIIVDILCDMCKESCKTEIIKNDIYNINYAKIEANFEYGSKLDDIYNELEDIYLCENCYLELLNKIGKN